MRPRPRDAAFEELVRHRRGELLRTATVLTAGDRHLAEDLVQGTLVRLYLAWGRATGREHVEAYTRRILVNLFIDHRRRASVVREQPTAVLPDRPAAPPAGTVEQADPELLAALADLPPRMRAAVVLRHVLDLGVEETADALGCSVGTVKSQTSRGLQKLREALPRLAPTRPGPTEGEPS